MDHNDTLIITRRQATVASALIVLFIGLTFISGYFIGLKHGTAACEVGSCQTSNNTEQLLDVKEEVIDTEDLLPRPTPCTTSPTQTLFVPSAGVETESQQLITGDEDLWYAAELISFSTYNAAIQCMQRIAKQNNIELELRTRHSKNQRGKTANWYQIVTKRHKSEQELRFIVAQIAKKEKLHNPKIVKLKTT